MPPPRALARPLYGSPGPSTSSSAGSASGAPAQGGNNPPHPMGPSPATPGGIPSSLPHTAKPPPPTREPGVAQFPPTAQPTPLPAPQALGLPRGRRDRASRGPRYSPAPLCFPSGPHGQEPPTASARSPQGLGRSEYPRLGPGSAVQGRPEQFSRSERQKPPATDCGRRDINKATDRCAGADTPPTGSGCAGRPHCHILPTLGEIIRYWG